MWAYVKDNKIEEIIARPKTMVIDDIRQPSRIFSAWSTNDLNSIGIYIVEQGSQGDSRFEITSQPTYTFDSSNKKVTTKYTTTNKSLDDVEAKDDSGNNILDANGDKIINYGLKTLAIKKCKTQANNYIKQFNWLVERSIYDNSKTIPDAVKTYVAAIRTDCAEIETAITNASDMTAFKALYTDELNSDGSIKTVARVDRWTSNSTVTDYIR